MSRRPVVHEGERIRNLWTRETVSGEPRFDVQVRVDGKPTFRVLKARTLDDALVELEGFRPPEVSAVEGHTHERGSTVRAMGESIEVIDVEVHDELVAIVRETVRAELQAWAGPAAVVDHDDVPPDPLEQFEVPEREHYSLDEPPVEPPWAVPEPAWDERQAAPGVFPLCQPATPPAQPVGIDRKEWARRFKERMEQKR